MIKNFVCLFRSKNVDLYQKLGIQRSLVSSVLSLNETSFVSAIRNSKMADNDEGKSDLIALCEIFTQYFQNPKN